jgi:hypothetical protein
VHSISFCVYICQEITIDSSECWIHIMKSKIVMFILISSQFFFVLSKSTKGMCISVFTLHCTRYLDILLRHVLVISFCIFDIMTDAEILENKNDWIPFVLFFFFAFYFLILSAFHSCLTSAIIIIINIINPYKA